MTKDSSGGSPTTGTRLRAAAGFVVLAFVVAVAVGYAGRTAPTPSPMDGRMLSGLPSPSTSSVLDGSWMAGVESWMDDRVVGRPSWLSLHAKLAQDVLNVVDLNGITVDPETDMEYEKPPAISEDPTLGPSARALGESARAAGAQVLFVYVPRKEEVFADRLPDGWDNPYTAGRGLATAAMAQGGPVLDLTDQLADPGSRGENYYLTDHHWTPRAALRALGAVDARAAEMGVELGPLPTLTDRTYGEFFGSYARRVTAAGTPQPDQMVIPTPAQWTGQLCGATKCGPPVIEKIARSPELYANRYAAYLGGDVGYQKFVNSDPDARGTVVIFKDSFGLPFVTYLAQQAKRVIAIDERYYARGEISDLLAQERPDLVLVMHNQVTLFRDELFDPRLWQDTAGVVAARRAP